MTMTMVNHLGETVSVELSGKLSPEFKKNLDLFANEGSVQIQSGIEGAILSAYVPAGNGHTARYDAHILNRESEYNLVEIGARDLVDQMAKSIALTPSTTADYDALKAVVLNKAMEVKNKFDTSDFTKFAGRIA